MLAYETLKDLHKNNIQFTSSLTFKKWIEGEFVFTTDLLTAGPLKIKGLREKLREQNIEITFNSLYFLVEFNSITTKGIDWEPILQPQVTIQHKLESTIHLLLSLFCSGSEWQNDGEKYTLLFTAYAQLVEEEKTTRTSAGIIKTILESLFSIKFWEGSVEHFPTNLSIRGPAEEPPKVLILS
jgi:hypothetical protein